MPVTSSASLFAVSDVKWVGAGIPSSRRGIERHFRKFILGGEEFGIGDFILISRQENISESHAKEDCYIARIIDLYEKELMYNKAEVQRLAEVVWYWQKQEVVGRLQRLLKGHKMEENEVILDLTNSFERDIDLETVVGKCKVRHIRDDSMLSPLATKEENNNGHIQTFIARRAYSGKGFVPLTGAEDEENFPTTPRTPLNNGRFRDSLRKEMTPNGNSVLSNSRSKSSPLCKSARRSLKDSYMNSSPLISLEQVRVNSSSKSSLKSPLEKMARLNQKTVVNMIMNDSDEDTCSDADSVNSGARYVNRVNRAAVNKTPSCELLGGSNKKSGSKVTETKTNRYSKSKYSKRQKHDHSRSDIGCHVDISPSPLKRLKLDKGQGKKENENIFNKLLTQNQVDIKQLSPRVLLSEISSDSPDLLSPDREKIKSCDQIEDSKPENADQRLQPYKIMSLNSSKFAGVANSPSISRVTGSPYRRKSIFEAPECENLIKTPEAKRKGSDKTPDSLEAGRRRLSVNLFGKLGSSSSTLLDSTGTEAPKSWPREKEMLISPTRMPGITHESVGDLDESVFSTVTPKRLSAAFVESSPRPSSSRSRRKPSRFTPEQEIAKTPKKSLVFQAHSLRTSPVSQVHSPRANLVGQVYSPKTSSLGQVNSPQTSSALRKKLSTKNDSPKTPSAIQTSQRQTPRRAASLKKISYAEFNQSDDDQETQDLTKVRISARSSSKQRTSRLTSKKQYIDDVLDDSDNDEDYNVYKDDESDTSDFDSDSESDKSIKDKIAPNTKLKKESSRVIRTPRSSKKTITEARPTMPSRSGPKPAPRNDLEEARARLHVSAVPNSLPCREKEFSDIFGFVESKILDGTGGCMYISGVPGTGKTATVKEVMKVLEAERDDGNLQDFKFVEVNGMKLTDPRQAYAEMLKALTGKEATADHAANILNKIFTAPAPRSSPVVLLVDELDLLWTRKQDVMYNIFDWPTKEKAKLIVLAVANTMDLPERMMMKRVASRLGLTRMTFQPYTFRQLEEIVASRLRGLRVFDNDAVQLAARKVAAVSGDARRALDICRRSTEIAEARAEGGKAAVMVGMSDINSAVEEMFCSPKIMAIRYLSLQEQLFLKAVVAEFQRSGIEEAEFYKLYDQHQVLCRFEGIHVPTMTELSAICYRLGSMRLLLTEPGCRDLSMRIRLNVSQDDIMYALRADTNSS